MANTEFSLRSYTWEIFITEIIDAAQKYCVRVFIFENIVFMYQMILRVLYSHFP